MGGWRSRGRPSTARCGVRCVHAAQHAAAPARGQCASSRPCRDRAERKKRRPLSRDVVRPHDDRACYDCNPDTLTTVMRRNQLDGRVDLRTQHSYSSVDICRPSHLVSVCYGTLDEQSVDRAVRRRRAASAFCPGSPVAGMVLPDTVRSIGRFRRMATVLSAPLHRRAGTELPTLGPWLPSIDCGSGVMDVASVSDRMASEQAMDVSVRPKRLERTGARPARHSQAAVGAGRSTTGHYAAGGSERWVA
jgi:hypothetical protein